MKPFRMKWSDMQLPTRLNVIGSLILLIGLGSALAIYLIAWNDAANATDAGDGSGYSIPIGQNKKYIHDVQLYGGNAAVLAVGINRWFDGLWEGESLAYTVAFIALVSAAGCFFVAYQTKVNMQSEKIDEDDSVDSS